MDDQKFARLAEIKGKVLALNTYPELSRLRGEEYPETLLESAYCQLLQHIDLAIRIEVTKGRKDD